MSLCFACLEMAAAMSAAAELDAVRRLASAGVTGMLSAGPTGGASTGEIGGDSGRGIITSAGFSMPAMGNPILVAGGAGAR